MSESLYYNNEDGNVPDVLTGICNKCGNKIGVAGIPIKLNSEGFYELPVANTNIITCSKCNTQFEISQFEISQFDHDVGIEAPLKDKEKIFGDLSDYPLLKMITMIN